MSERKSLKKLVFFYNIEKETLLPEITDLYALEANIIDDILVDGIEYKSFVYENLEEDLSYSIASDIEIFSEDLEAKDLLINQDYEGFVNYINQNY